MVKFFLGKISHGSASRPKDRSYPVDPKNIPRDCRWKLQKYRGQKKLEFNWEERDHRKEQGENAAIVEERWKSPILWD